MRDLRNRVVVVTGASSGIGRATALAFAREGSCLVLAARRRELLEGLARELAQRNARALAVPTDVGDRAKVQALVAAALDHFGRIDVLVSNAGLYHRCMVADLALADVERVMAVNFYAFLHLVQAALPHLQAQGAGHIVLVSSVDGRKGLPPDGAYVAAKFAATGLAEVLRQELHGTGVRVSTVFPGRVDTPMIADIAVPFVSAKAAPERIASSIVKAVRREKAEVVVPASGWALLVSSFLSPRLGDWLVRRLGLAGQDRSRTAPAETERERRSRAP